MIKLKSHVNIVHSDSSGLFFKNIFISKLGTSIIYSPYVRGKCEEIYSKPSVDYLIGVAVAVLTP